jgi:hypothetical protein
MRTATKIAGLVAAAALGLGAAACGGDDGADIRDIGGTTGTTGSGTGSGSGSGTGSGTGTSTAETTTAG